MMIQTITAIIGNGAAIGNTLMDASGKATPTTPQTPDRPVQPLLGPHPLPLMISTRQTKDRPNAKAVVSWSNYGTMVRPGNTVSAATTRSKQANRSAVESTSRPAVSPEPCIRYAGREITPGAATVPDSTIGNCVSTSNGCLGSTKSKEEYQTDEQTRLLEFPDVAQDDVGSGLPVSFWQCS